MGKRKQIPVDPDREAEELKAYLGPDYEEARLHGYHGLVEEELSRIGDEQTLYRTSQAYLYDLTAFAMTEIKRPYREALARLIQPPAHLLDYGCGIGSDGLAFLEAGYQVTFADFDNPSTRYLRWRLERRGLQAPVYDLDSDELPGGFDAVYSFDVIEHVDDPHGFLGEMERRAALVVVNFLEPEPGETELHRELPIAALLDHCARRKLRSYGFHHARSHLVAYEPGEASALRHFAARLRIGRRVLRGLS